MNSPSLKYTSDIGLCFKFTHANWKLVPRGLKFKTRHSERRTKVFLSGRVRYTDSGPKTLGKVSVKVNEGWSEKHKERIAGTVIEPVRTKGSTQTKYTMKRGGGDNKGHVKTIRPLQTIHRRESHKGWGNLKQETPNVAPLTSCRTF